MGGWSGGREGRKGERGGLCCTERQKLREAADDSARIRPSKTQQRDPDRLGFKAQKRLDLIHVRRLPSSHEQHTLTGPSPTRQYSDQVGLHLPAYARAGLHTRLDVPRAENEQYSHDKALKMWNLVL